MTYPAVLFACTHRYTDNSCQYYVYMEPGEDPGRCLGQRMQYDGPLGEGKVVTCDGLLTRVGEFELEAS